MGVINALLIETAYGWDECIRQSSIDTYGRREALYGLGSYNSAVDVQRVANARLDVVATPRYQYDATHDPPTIGELPYHGYDVFDFLPVTTDAGMSDEAVVSIAVSEDNNTGQATVTLALNDVVMYASPVENFVAMLKQWARMMIPGTGGGDWQEAQPVTPFAQPATLPPTPAAGCCGWTDDNGGFYLVSNPDPGFTPGPNDGGRNQLIDFFPNPPYAFGPYPCSPDMAVEARIITWETDVQGDGLFQMDVRDNSPTPRTFIIDEGGAAGANARWYIGDFSSELVGFDAPTPVPGDVLRFEVIGDTATAYKNGAAILSVSGVSTDMGTSFSVFGAVFLLAAGSGAGPYEMRSTFLFTSYC